MLWGVVKMENKRIWNHVTGTGFDNFFKVVADAQAKTEFEMKLCRNHPKSLKWMGGYIKQIAEVKV